MLTFRETDLDAPGDYAVTYRAAPEITVGSKVTVNGVTGTVIESRPVAPGEWTTVIQFPRLVGEPETAEELAALAGNRMRMRVPRG